MKEINREIDLMKSDKKQFEIELMSFQNKYSKLLKNELGKDIDNVLSGKIKVKLTLKERFKYFIKNIFNKI